jgi:type IV secretory pathway component VirB8
MSDTTIGWTAEPVPPDSRNDQLRDQASFAALDRKRRKTFSTWLIIDAAASKAIALAAGITLGIVIHREKPVDKEYITVDSSTGYVGSAVGARDAPKTFTARVAMADLIKYTKARLAYLPEEDPEQWNTVRAMSTKDCFGIYDKSRQSPDSFVKQLGMTGHVIVHNFTNDLHPIHNKDDSWTYSIRFDLQQVKGVTIGVLEHWQADTTFAWHPEMRMTTEDEHRNYTGFQCIAYNARRMS